MMRTSVIAAALFSSLLLGCATGESTVETDTDRSEQPAVAREVADAVESDDETEPVSIDTEQLDADAVVAAVVLIASGGDLEQAIADGLVSEAEAEAALRGLENGTLADFFD